MTDLEQQLTDHLRQRAAAATPRYDLEAVEAGLSPYAPVDLDERRRRRLLIPAVVGVAAAVALVVAIAVVRQVQDRDAATPVTEPEQGRMATFVSTRHGFAISHLDRWGATVTPATQLWGFSQHVDDGFDVVETGSGAVFRGSSTDLDELLNGRSIDAAVDQFLSEESVLSDGCGVPRSEQAVITIDGQSGRVSACANRIEATVDAGGRLYLFTLTDDRSEARADFDAFVATIDLRPETAITFPGLTSTFVSPTNGFSFDFHDRGGLAPATGLWDPDSDQRDVVTSQDGFDAVETAMGAYFLAASTPIPDGVSVDGWVDDYVSPGPWLEDPGSCAPRRLQAAITIDGQPGRIAECSEGSEATVGRIDATVVAGGRLYLFTLLHSRSDGRAFFDAWIDSVDLRPEAAAVP